jgi:hypothetical protein
MADKKKEPERVPFQGIKLNPPPFPLGISTSEEMKQALERRQEKDKKEKKSDEA